MTFVPSPAETGQIKPVVSSVSCLLFEWTITLAPLTARHFDGKSFSMKNRVKICSYLTANMDKS
jgi:hypothetical protein